MTEKFNRYVAHLYAGLHEMRPGTHARLNGIGCCDFNLKPVSMWF